MGRAHSNSGRLTARVVRRIAEELELNIISVTGRHEANCWRQDRGTGSRENPSRLCGASASPYREAESELCAEVSEWKGRVDEEKRKYKRL